MTIKRVTEDDISQLLNIAELAVCESVDAPASSKTEIIEGISKNINEWHAKIDCAFYKFTRSGVAIGFVLIKEHWNFSDVFVLPDFHSQGVGRKLTEHALLECRERSDKNSVKVNSSKNAANFYRHLGFGEREVCGKLPYEMVPLEYYF